MHKWVKRKHILSMLHGMFCEHANKYHILSTYGVLKVGQMTEPKKLPIHSLRAKPMIEPDLTGTRKFTDRTD